MPTPPGKISRLLASPSPEYIEKEEISVDLVPPEQARLEITDRAAEVRAPFPSRSLMLSSARPPSTSNASPTSRRNL